MLFLVLHLWRFCYRLRLHNILFYLSDQLLINWYATINIQLKHLIPPICINCTTTNNTVSITVPSFTVKNFLCNKKRDITNVMSLKSWASRIRTCRYWNQNPGPYHLAIAQHYGVLCMLCFVFSTSVHLCIIQECTPKCNS